MKQSSSKLYPRPMTTLSTSAQSFVKLKEEIFVVPDILKLMSMHNVRCKKRATGFLGNVKNLNYISIVKDLLKKNRKTKRPHKHNLTDLSFVLLDFPVRYATKVCNGVDSTILNYRIV